jgi:hypothetical protein
VSGRLPLNRESLRALIAEMPTPEVELTPTSGSAKLDEKMRKIEFYMMVIVGLILVVLILDKMH